MTRSISREELDEIEESGGRVIRRPTREELASRKVIEAVSKSAEANGAALAKLRELVEEVKAPAAGFDVTVNRDERGLIKSFRVTPINR